MGESPKKGLDVVGGMGVKGNINLVGKTVVDGKICFGGKDNKMTLIPVGNSYQNGKWNTIKEVNLPKDVTFVLDKPHTKELKPINTHPFKVKIDTKRKKVIVSRADVKTGWSHNIYLKGFKVKPVEEVCLDPKFIHNIEKKIRKIRLKIRKDRHLINKKTRTVMLKNALIKNKTMLRHLNRLHVESKHSHKHKRHLNKLIGRVKCSILKARWLGSRRSSRYWLNRYRRKRSWLARYRRAKRNERNRYRSYRRCISKSKRSRRVSSRRSRAYQCRMLKRRVRSYSRAYRRYLKAYRRNRRNRRALSYIED